MTAVTNSLIQNVYKGQSPVSRMMLGLEQAWPKFPGFTFTAADATALIKLDFQIPTRYLLFQVTGAGTRLFTAPYTAQPNKTLYTIAHGSENLYRKNISRSHSYSDDYNLRTEAYFSGTLALEVRTTHSRYSRTNRYTPWVDYQTGKIDITYTNDFGVDVPFTVEVKSGSTVVATVASTALQSNTTRGILKHGLPSGYYTLKITNGLTGAVYEMDQVRIRPSVSGRGGNSYSLTIDLNTEAPSLFKKTISVYPTTQEKAYQAFYGSTAIIEIVAYNMNGDYYTYRTGPDGAIGYGYYYDIGSQASGAVFIFAKLVSGGSGYRPNAFYPTFYNNEKSNVDHATAQNIPILVALTDSTGSVTQIVEYDEHKYGYRLYNDRTSGAGMHWLHYHTAYYSVWRGGKGGSSYLTMTNPQYVTYLDPLTGTHLTDPLFSSSNFITTDVAQYSRTDPVTQTDYLIDPFENEGNADIVAILGNVADASPYHAYNNDTHRAFNENVSFLYLDGPNEFHTLDPEEDWFDATAGGQTTNLNNTTVVSDTPNTKIYSDGFPWRTGTDSPTYKYTAINRYAQDADNAFRALNDNNLSKKSIEFANRTTGGSTVVAGSFFQPGLLEEDPDVSPILNADFYNTEVSGLTAENQPLLRSLRGNTFETSVDPRTSLDDKIDITPNTLDGVFGSDYGLTDVKEYCILEIGAIIPGACAQRIQQFLKTHPGDHRDYNNCFVSWRDDPSWPSEAELTLYTIYIRLKAKGTGYPPNSKIPVYLRRSGAFVQGYDSNRLPANPGPTLEYGHVSDIKINGRGSGGPCICMIHTDAAGVTTHITEYVDPKSVCRSDPEGFIYPNVTFSGQTRDVTNYWPVPRSGAKQVYDMPQGSGATDFTADVNDGANYDGTESPFMQTEDGSQWYRERPSQYRRLVNLGEVSDSLYGYAKDYIAPIDLADDFDWGKARWTDTSWDYMLKAYHFGCLARFKNASNYEITNRIISPIKTFDDNGFIFATDQYNQYRGIPDYQQYTFCRGTGQCPPAYYLRTPTKWQQAVSKHDAFRVSSNPSAYQTSSGYIFTSSRLGDTDGFSIPVLWQSFKMWQTFRDVYKTKGITYNRSTDISNLQPVRQLLNNEPYLNGSDLTISYSGGVGAAAHNVPAYLRFDTNPVASYNKSYSPFYREEGMEYYYSPGIQQGIKDDNNILFDRHGLTNEGFPAEDKVPHLTEEMGPDYIVCRVVTPHNISRGPNRSPLIINGGLQGQRLQTIRFSHGGVNTNYITKAHCYHVYGHDHWISLGDSDAANGGRKIIVQDAFRDQQLEYKEYTITPGVYQS